MFQYGWTLNYVKKLTRNQIFLFLKRIEKRISLERKFQASLHNVKLESKGLDKDGAISIEELIDTGGKLF